MNFFYYLAAFLLVRRLRRSLKLSILYPKWKSMLSIATWGIIIVCFASFTLEDFARDALGAIILLGILYYISEQNDFQSQKPYLLANIPLVAMGFINALIELV